MHTSWLQRLPLGTFLLALAAPTSGLGCREDAADLQGPSASEVAPPTDSTTAPAAPATAPPTALDGPFVPIYRQISEATIEQRRLALSGPDGGRAPAMTQDFYLALNKKELGSKWFLSAYLSQLAPNGVASGAARSLGTRVVSFKVQNGKLFMFDVADDKEWSDTFRPEVVLEAYPIVEGFAPFERQRGASDYVLFDPAAGLNRFRLLQDTWAPIEIELSFSQRFRKVADGATFDQVFSGTLRAQSLLNGSSTTLVSPPSMTGTLSLGLRRYSEGEAYVPTAMPPKEHYFRSLPKLVPNQGTLGFVATKWNLRAGGKPIVWKIAGLAEKLGQHPDFKGVDFAGAIKNGIESWNQAFGFAAVQAQIAGPDESYGDDDVNYFIFDSSRSYGGAFANIRRNPNNGEIRGASVYFPVGLLGAVGALPPPPSGPSAAGEEFEAGAPDNSAPAFRLAWGSAAEESLCELGLPSLEEVLRAEVPGAPPMSAKEKIERFLGNIAAHEVGHTFGLRHNFKGSLKPPSSSVMEYVDIPDTIATGPQISSYDIAAIRYLYGLSTELPHDAFCTDEQADVVDPDCRRFDRGARPLSDYFVPTYRTGLESFLAAKSNGFPAPRALAPHIRLATMPAVRLEAYEGAVGPVRTPVLSPAQPPPMFAARVNAVTQTALRQLFIEPQPGQTVVPGQPPPAARPPAEPVLSAAIADVKGFILNSDGIRVAATRRLGVDVLKLFQSVGAYTALAEAHALLSEQLPSLTGPAAVETKDLLSRIERSLTAYFD